MQDYIAPVHHRELSIQIGLNGFSFVVFNNAAAATPEAIKEENVMYSAFYGNTPFADIVASEPILTEAPFGRAFVSCSTDNVLMIPVPLFEQERTDQYLAAANMYQPGMTTLSNNLLSYQAVGVWQVESALAAELIHYFPSALFYHPLLLELDAVVPWTVHIALDQRIAHVTVFHEGLYAAETFQAESAEELLYYVMKLIKNDGFTQYKVILTGEGAGNLVELFSHYFNEVEPREDRFYSHQKIREVCAL